MLCSSRHYTVHRPTFLHSNSRTGMASSGNGSSSPSNLLTLLILRTRPIPVGQLAMATGHMGERLVCRRMATVGRSACERWDCIVERGQIVGRSPDGRKSRGAVRSGRAGSRWCGKLGQTHKLKYCIKYCGNAALCNIV